MSFDGVAGGLDVGQSRGEVGLALAQAFDVGGVMVGRTIGVCRDNKWITYTDTSTEGDVWVATRSR